MSNHMAAGRDPRPDRQDQVRTGYDRIAEDYLASKSALDPEAEDLLSELLEGSAPDAPVLDLGCGAGVPVTQWLAERRQVLGVDLSRRQLALCRRYVPSAWLLQADLTDLALRDASCGSVVSMYAIIHVPREEHRSLLERVYRWLLPGGAFLATWPMNEWEGEEQDWFGWGATMWWSHFGRDANLAMLESTGFKIERAVDRHGDESWCWVLARKPA